jgi:hypothetical protein
MYEFGDKTCNLFLKTIVYQVLKRSVLSGKESKEQMLVALVWAARIATNKVQYLTLRQLI